MTTSVVGRPTKRGGSRAGAGRHPDISNPDDRLEIGYRCERRWQSALAEAEEARRELLLRPLNDLWKQARAVPAGKRRKFVRDGEMYFDDVDGAIRALLKIPADLDDDEAKKLRILPKARPPRGLKRSIIEDVSKDETRDRGVQVTCRRVEAYWKEWRAFQARITRHLEDYLPELV